MAKFVKGVSLVIIALFMFNISANVAYAAQPSGGGAHSEGTHSAIETGSNEIDANCNTVLGDIEDPKSVAYLLQEIFKVMKFATPLLVLVFSIIDFIKSVTTQDKEILQKAIKRTIIRVIVGLVVFVIPSICDFVFNLLGWYGTCGIK